MASRSLTQGFGVVFGVAGAQLGGDGRGVEHGVVEDLAAGVVEDGLDVLRGGEAGALVGLGHQVADVDAQGSGAADGLGDSVHQQVGDATGEQRAGADADDVGVVNGVERLGQRAGVGAGPG